jgi:pimeloyl-ACP methyl ester carboxylesterase
MHVRDIRGVLEAEDLHEVTLVGHSYGGMVATWSRDLVRERRAGVV